MRRRRWTVDELALLHRNWGRLTTTAIARSLGRTWSAVYYQARRCGLATGSTALDPEVVAEIGRLLRVGLTYRQIAAQVGVCEETVYRYRARLGLPRRQLGSPCRPATVELIRAGLAAGRRYREIAAEAGVSDTTVRNYRDRWSHNTGGAR